MGGVAIAGGRLKYFVDDCRPRIYCDPMLTPQLIKSFFSSFFGHIYLWHSFFFYLRNGKRIKTLSDNLINQTDDSLFNGYISSRQVRYQPDPHSRSAYYCAITCIREKEFNACQKKHSGIKQR
jgi:hypothetical protein